MQNITNFTISLTGAFAPKLGHNVVDFYSELENIHT